MFPLAVICPLAVTLTLDTSIPALVVSNFLLPAKNNPTLNASESVFRRRSVFLSITLKLILLPPGLIVAG